MPGERRSLAARRVPPGRAGVLWLRRRLALATRGADLLRQKLAILVAERQRLQALTEQTAARWHSAAESAERWLVRAAVHGGQAALAAAALPPAARVELAWSDVMGLRYPDEPRCLLPERPPDATPLHGAALLLAERAYRAAVPAALRHAAATAALRRVDREVRLTRQRIRALERHWIPRLEESLALSLLAMAESEHGDTVRRLAAQDRDDRGVVGGQKPHKSPTTPRSS